MGCILDVTDKAVKPVIISLNGDRDVANANDLREGTCPDRLEFSEVIESGSIVGEMASSAKFDDPIDGSVSLSRREGAQTHLLS